MANCSLDLVTTLHHEQSAKEIFLFQKLEVLLKMMATAVPEVEVQDVTVIDANSGSTTTKIASFLEQLRQTTGVDITQLAHQVAKKPNDLPSLNNQIPPTTES